MLRPSRRNRFALPCLALLLVGCGGAEEQEAALVDPLNLIENFDPNPARHHPTKLIEVSLGSFALSRPSPDRAEVVTVTFDAYAILPLEAQDKYTGRIEERKARIADQINRLVQSAGIADLNDPELLWLKAEILPVVGRILQTDEIRDIVINEFSISVG
ncbi:MAG TPA: hypothetical protein DCQ98_05975 [Planctomycetaceae bacterium]|nr:hypothetical protein [Planctomycetaceae bacterium]HRF00554.1 hypothetical protein [Pirellulaceae bacterium]